MMVELRRLRVLQAVAAYGTVTAAAHALYLTPSAASQQLRHLARDVGVTLLERHGRHVRLTPAARRLLTHADAIAERWAQAEADLAGADPSAPAGPLRLCGFPTVISALLAPLAARLQHAHPAVAVHIREAEPDDCYALLFTGEADLAITMPSPTSPAATDARFDQQPLLDDPYELLTAPEHPLAGQPELTLAELADQPWILGMPGTEYRQMILALCNTAGFTPTIAHEALEWTAIAHLIGHGLGISLIHHLARLPDQPPLTRTPLAQHARPHRRLLSVTRRGNRTDSAIAAALTLLDTPETLTLSRTTT